MPYDIGSTVRVKTTFTDVDSGAQIDPTSVVFTVYRPGGVTSTPSVTHVSTGLYEITFVPDIAGRWVVGVVTTGPTSSGQRLIPVNPVPMS
jgi:hypothetical protein